MASITMFKRIASVAAVFAVIALSAVTIVMAVNDAEKPQPIVAGSEAAQADHYAAGATIEHASVDTFEDLVLRSRRPVLVDFYADWCGPCQIQNGVLKEFAGEFADGKIIKVDVDENPELAARYDVKGLPTLLIFQGGQVIGRQVGLATKEQLKAALAD